MKIFLFAERMLKRNCVQLYVQNVITNSTQLNLSSNSEILHATENANPPFLRKTSSNKKVSIQQKSILKSLWHGSAENSGQNHIKVLPAQATFPQPHTKKACVLAAHPIMIRFWPHSLKHTHTHMRLKNTVARAHAVQSI